MHRYIKWKNILEDLSVDGRVLNLIIRSTVGDFRLDSSGSGNGRMAGFCEKGGTFGFINGRGIS